LAKTILVHERSDIRDIFSFTPGFSQVKNASRFYPNRFNGFKQLWNPNERVNLETVLHFDKELLRHRAKATV
jgi:hypothetical protein